MEDTKIDMTNQEAIKTLQEFALNYGLNDKMIDAFGKAIRALEEQPKTGHCKDCKWWKDSDGAFRRGIGAESQCPLNRIEVYEGNGYCFLFVPQESEE